MQIFSGSIAYDVLSPFGVVVQRWSNIDVRNWLFGLGDFILEYLPNFREIDGNALLCLFNEDLKDLGVQNCNVRRKICRFLKQLTHLCYDAEDENLQILIAGVGTEARNLYSELRRHFNTRSERALPLNFVSLCNRLDEKVKKLLSWFDRPPFSGEERFSNLRESISTISLDILDWNLNDDTLTKEQCRQLITSLQISCAQLYTLCDKILQESCDILLIQNSYFERCDLNRKSADIDLGISFDTVENCHIVKSLKFQSPADLARKIDVGDEILDINGQVVVGWTAENVQNRLFSLKSLKITLLLKKQPRDSWNVFKLSAPRHRKITVVAAIPKIAADPTLNPGNDDEKIADDSSPIRKNRDAVKRRRSSSFSHGFRVKIGENPDRNDEATILRRSRKWKSAKAPTVPLSARLRKTTTALRPRWRRITVSGGSPTMKRLSLHVHDRKCSLMPQESRTDKADAAILESPQVKQKLTQLFSTAMNQSTSSSNDGGGQQKSPMVNNVESSWSPIDDVFDNSRMNETLNRGLENFVDSQKTINLGDEEKIEHFSEVSVGPLVPADDVLWRQETKIEDEPLKLEHQNFDLKGVVDFGGPIILSNMVNETSKKKIERFFGENFDESLEKITSSDNVSTFSSDDESSLQKNKNRHRRSSSPVNKLSPKSPSSQKSLKIVADVKFGRKDSKNNILLEDSISSTGSQLSLLSKSPHRFLWNYWKNSNLSLNNVNTSQNLDSALYKSLNNEQLSAQIFDQSGNVAHCGWLFRYKFPGELSSHAPKHQSRWLMRWAVLRDDILRLYVNEQDSRPEGLICLNGCKVRPCPSIRLKSSKKNIFQIVYENASFYFYCHERKDMVEWLNKLGLSAIGYSKPEKIDSTLKGFYFEKFMQD